MASNLDVVVGKLAELAIIQPNFLLVGADTQRQAGNEVHEEQDDAGDHKRVREPGNTVSELIAELDVVVVDPTAGDLRRAVKVGNVVAASTSA